MKSLCLFENRIWTIFFTEIRRFMKKIKSRQGQKCIILVRKALILLAFVKRNLAVVVYTVELRWWSEIPLILVTSAWDAQGFFNVFMYTKSTRKVRSWNWELFGSFIVFSSLLGLPKRRKVHCRASKSRKRLTNPFLGGGSNSYIKVERHCVPKKWNVKFQFQPTLNRIPWTDNRPSTLFSKGSQNDFKKKFTEAYLPTDDLC